jgi:hypothetical protein
MRYWVSTIWILRRAALKVQGLVHHLRSLFVCLVFWELNFWVSNSPLEMDRLTPYSLPSFPICWCFCQKHRRQYGVIEANMSIIGVNRSVCMSVYYSTCKSVFQLASFCLMRYRSFNAAPASSRMTEFAVRVSSCTPRFVNVGYMWAGCTNQ